MRCDRDFMRTDAKKIVDKINHVRNNFMDMRTEMVLELERGQVLVDAPDSSDVL